MPPFAAWDYALRPGNFSILAEIAGLPNAAGETVLD
jgi:hypothetical protein